MRGRERVYEPRPDRDADGPILGRHALLVVEVADTSAAYDREIKLKRYAADDDPVVWIVDVSERHVEVYTLPELDTYAVRETPDVLQLPDGGEIRLDEVLPAG